MFDGLNRISTVSHPDFGATSVNFTYTTDSNNNAIAVQYPNWLKQEITHDALLELTTHTNSKNSESQWTEKYRYDGFWNIASIDRNRGG